MKAVSIKSPFARIHVYTHGRVFLAASALFTILAFCLAALRCTSPTPHDYFLSSEDKAEIMSLASRLRDQPVDSIVVGDHSCGIMVPFWGTIYFHPEPIDSDMIVFSSLGFCHIDWPAYSTLFADDSGWVVSNGWAMSGLLCDTDLVVVFDPCTLFVRSRNPLPKDTVVYYLNKIYNQDFTTDSSWKGDPPQPICDMNRKETLLYFFARADTAFIELDFFPGYTIYCGSGDWVYHFAEVAGALSFRYAATVSP